MADQTAHLMVIRILPRTGGGRVEVSERTDGEEVLAAVHDFPANENWLDAVKPEIHAIQDRGVTKTIVDMSGVRWINSTALGVLMYLFSELSREGRSVIFAGANERVRKIFQATKLDRILTLADSPEAAVEQFSD